MIVLDASVVANVVADDGTDGDVARAAIRQGKDAAAPVLVDVEVMAVLRKRWLAGELSEERFGVSVADLTDFPIERYEVLPLMGRIFELRSNLTPYDAVYVALAELLDAPLLTFDGRLKRSTGPTCDIEVLRARR